jgi:hypothetical protein
MAIQTYGLSMMFCTFLGALIQCGGLGCLSTLKNKKIEEQGAPSKMATF